MENWSLILLGKFCKLVKNMSGLSYLRVKGTGTFIHWQRGLQRTVKTLGKEMQRLAVESWASVHQATQRSRGMWARQQQHPIFGV